MSFEFPPASDSSGMPWPAGIYQVTLLSIEPDDRPSRFGDTPRAKWVFEVTKVIRLAPVADQAQRQENRAKAQKSLNEGADLLAWCNVTMNRKATMRGAPSLSSPCEIVAVYINGGGMRVVMCEYDGCLSDCAIYDLRLARTAEAET